MPVQSGDTLLHYRIVEKIGEGGMGVVWKAVDTSLDREVAIKVLPDALSGHAERLARFEREAKLLATLNHPSIAVVYGLHEASGVRFIAMELVAGQDLGVRIESGALPIDEAVEIARQVASAVEAAHESGVIHRDLKPANVVVGDAGQIKVLDFGLAKALSPDAGSSEASPSLSPTVTSAGSVAGVLLGTGAYMSPEQAKGRMVDRRADIWSFGCLLYEMLTGRRTFEGGTISETLASVLKDDVDWDALPASTPGAVVRLLRRCLDRDPDTRLRDIGEARVALAAPFDEFPAAESPAARRKGVVAAAVLIVVLAGLAAGWWLRPAPREPTMKLDVWDRELVANGRHRPMLSPDGSRVAYFAEETLRIRDLDRAEAQEVPNSRLASAAFWSPDGTQIAFSRGDSLFRAPVDGGAPVLVARIGNLVPGAGGCWSEDGRIVYSRGNTSLYEVPSMGGEPRVLLAPDPQKNEGHFHECSFLPGDRGMLFAVHPLSTSANTIALLVGGEVRYLLQLSGESVHGAEWSPSGHIVFHRSGGGRDGIWALPFDLSRLEPTGEAFPVVAGGAVSSVAANGSLVYATRQSDERAKLVWVARDGTVEGTAFELDGMLWEFSLSADGTRIVTAVLEQGVPNLWVADLARGTRMRLTTGWDPAWSSDGKRIVFGRDNDVFVVDVSSGEPPRRIGQGLAPTFANDDRHVVAHRAGGDGIYDLWLLDSAGQEEERRLVDEDASARWAVVSPAGGFMAFSSGDETAQLFVTRYPEARGRWQASAQALAPGSANTVGWVRWSPDGKRLFYVGGSPADIMERQVFEVDFDGDPEVVLGAPRPLFSLRDAGVRPALETTDGERFLMRTNDSLQTVNRLVLVRNWYDEFR